MSTENEHTNELFRQSSIGKWLLLTNSGKEIKFEWDGGSDSGWGDIKVDGKDVNFDECDELSDFNSFLLDKLGYNGFGSSFCTNGTLYFDPQKLIFSGTDYYSVEEGTERDLNLLLNVPSSIWFDQLSILIEDDSVWVQLDVLNGPLTNEHKRTQEYIKEEIESYLSAYLGEDRYYLDFTFSPQLAEFSNETIEVNIETIFVYYDEVTTNDVEIDVTAFITDKTYDNT